MLVEPNPSPPHTPTRISPSIPVPRLKMSRAAITGAYSYTGRYLARHLLDKCGVTSVLSLSSRPSPVATHNLDANHLERIETVPLNFDDPLALTRALEGCNVVYCTYWIRFARSGDTHQAAAERVKTLAEAAAAAGARKFIFSSHTHTSVDSPYAYIAGKALAEDHVRKVSHETGMNYALVRPCGIFGDTPAESILLNNAAWVMRRTPLFLLAGDGSHHFQPVHVRDMATLMAELGQQSIDTTGEERDACGPDSPTALELFGALKRATKSCAVVRAAHLPPSLLVAATRPLDWFTGDTLLDADDMGLLTSGLTVANVPDDSAIQKRQSVMKWIAEHGDELGRVYVSSVKRYYYPRI